MMALNRYRLKHLKSTGHAGAHRAARLLHRPDRLIGLILIGNNLVNIAAASLATAICVRLYGNAGYIIATVSLTLIILVFAEVTPKTFAALYPEKIAFPASWLLQGLQVIFMPFVVATNSVSNSMIRWLGGDPHTESDNSLSFDELKLLVQEAGSNFQRKRRSMLMNILDLENVEVDDIMIPRNEIYAIDINADAQTIYEQIRASEYTRVLLYRNELDDLVGILHLRDATRFLSQDDTKQGQLCVDKRTMIEEATEPYFVPEGTPLHTQLFNFQTEKRRVGVVVDEYGVVQGIIAIDDILEEIVGNYTTNFAEQFADITASGDDNYIINGSTTIRDINKQLDWKLPTEGPKTLNGLILEKLESFPDSESVSLAIGDYQMEIIDLQDNRINSVRVSQAPVG